MMDPGDLIQIAPHHKWSGCYATVDEVKSFGCVAFVRLPHNDGSPPGRAYIRLATEDFTVIAGVKDEVDS